MKVCPDYDEPAKNLQTVTDKCRKTVSLLKVDTVFIIDEGDRILD